MAVEKENQGCNALTDQVIAMDLLTATKAGVKMYAMAVTEAATPEVRSTFEAQLFQAIESHEKVLGYMLKKGLYHPFDVQEQIQLDLTNARTALNLPPA